MLFSGLVEVARGDAVPTVTAGERGEREGLHNEADHGLLTPT